MPRRSAVSHKADRPGRHVDRKRADVLAHRAAAGPFDVVGDVHGCLPELLALMAKLGYGVEPKSSNSAQWTDHFAVTPPPGRKLVFSGDLVDRGPDSAGVLRLVMSMMQLGQALSVAGNRDVELARALKGRAVQVTLGMARSLDQLAAAPAGFRTEALRFLDGLASHYVLDEGRLVVAHAGLKEALHGRSTPEARAIALRGQPTGESDDFGVPIRMNWAAEYRGAALVAYGHSPVAEPLWLNNTVNLDTGCVYGGHLTALRYPERETVSVPARAIYYRARRPFPVNGELKKAGR